MYHLLWGLAELLTAVELLGLLVAVELLVFVGLVELVAGAQGRRGGGNSLCWICHSYLNFCFSLSFSYNYFHLILLPHFLYYFTTLFLFYFLISSPYFFVLVMVIYSLLVVLFTLLLYIKFLFSVTLSCH